MSLERSSTVELYNLCTLTVCVCVAELEEQRKKPGSSQRRELDQLRQENTSLQQRLGQERLRHQTVSTTSSHSSVGRCITSFRTFTVCVYSIMLPSEDGPVKDGYENVTTDRERGVSILPLRRYDVMLVYSSEAEKEKATFVSAVFICLCARVGKLSMNTS